MKKRQLKLKDYEAHIASMCVAIISGSIGGALALPVPEYGYGIAGILGYAVAWLVCKFAFPSAHKWYGHDSWSHRIYDIVGFFSGVLVYWLIK